MHDGETRRVLNVFPEGFEGTFAHDENLTFVVYESGEVGMVDFTRRINHDEIVWNKRGSGGW